MVTDLGHLELPEFLSEGINVSNSSDRAVCQIAANIVCTFLDTCSKGNVCPVDLGCPSDCKDTCTDCNDTCPDTPIVYTPATFSISNITDTSATFTISAGQGYQNVRLLVRLYDDPSDLTYDSSNPTGDGPIVALPMPAKTLDITVTKFQPSTHYAANVHSFGGTSGRGEAGLKDFQTKAAKPIITPWSWSESNGNATPAQTQRSYNTITGGLPAEGFSYLVWNDLVDKIYEVVSKLNLNWNTTYTTYAGAKLSGPRQILTAAKYNSARHNVGMRYSTGINEVSSGQEFTWSYIYNLTQKLNGWISSL